MTLMHTRPETQQLKKSKDCLLQSTYQATSRKEKGGLRQNNFSLFIMLLDLFKNITGGFTLTVSSETEHRSQGKLVMWKLLCGLGNTSWYWNWDYLSEVMWVRLHWNCAVINVNGNAVGTWVRTWSGSKVCFLWWWWWHHLFPHHMCTMSGRGTLFCQNSWGDNNSTKIITIKKSCCVLCSPWTFMMILDDQQIHQGSIESCVCQSRPAEQSQTWFWTTANLPSLTSSSKRKAILKW